MADRMTLADPAIKNSMTLMQNAGRAVAEVIMEERPTSDKIAVLCGNGNNGGDGFVAAEYLRRKKRDVTCYTDVERPMRTNDAFEARRSFQGDILPYEQFRAHQDCIIVDALIGAGLDRPITGQIAELIKDINNNGAPVISIDLPSGISGRTGKVMGVAIDAELTVTFFRKKIGHVLYPGRHHCARVLVKNIGIKESVLTSIKPKAFVNKPELWVNHWPHLAISTHKYQRGHAAVFTGPTLKTGAARLTARAAARIGAGAVTILGDKAALEVHANHLTSIMLHEVNSAAEALRYILSRQVRTCVLGPGFNDLERAREFVLMLLKNAHIKNMVLDADALTAFSDCPECLFKAINDSTTEVILTPHEGEFSRLFKDISLREELSKAEKASHAAKRSHAIVVYKGPDSVIAAPNGELIINDNGTPLLATAGSGDVLAGIICGLLAQNMPALLAACSGVWVHAAAAQKIARNLIAEDLVEVLPHLLTQPPLTNMENKQNTD